VNRLPSESPLSPKGARCLGYDDLEVLVVEVVR
jgi:hypothetical protein